ncbi:hypothetical protein GCM10009577_18150 [Streptomyces javensis]
MGRDGMNEGEAERVIRVVVVDDEALVRSGFQLILGAAPDIEVARQHHHHDRRPDRRLPPCGHRPARTTRRSSATRTAPEFTKADAPDDYGRIGNQAGSDASPVLLGDYKDRPGNGQGGEGDPRRDEWQGSLDWQQD